MEPTQAKPVKNRRRWLIAAFVLVLLSMCSWWYWPRGDARFVGKWHLFREAEAGPTSEIRFIVDGTLVVTNLLEGIPYRATWHTEKDKLYQSVAVPPASHPQYAVFRRAVEEGNGDVLQMQFVEFRILKSERDEFELLGGEGDGRIRLVRIPE